MAWGGMVLERYFLSHKTFFFRALIWVCVHFSHPKGRGTALLYAALSFLFGGLGTLSGLGILSIPTR